MYHTRAQGIDTLWPGIEGKIGGHSKELLSELCFQECLREPTEVNA